MASGAALVALLQVMDSAFPVGTFAHSYGLEQAVRDGFVRDATGLDAFVRSVITGQVAESEVRTLVAAHRAAEARDIERVCAEDRRLFATKAVSELRDASTSTGRRLLQELAAHPEGRVGLVEPYRAQVEAGATPGTHAASAAVAGAAFRIDAEDLAAGFLFSTANTLVQAAMRLLPVSHRDAQATLHHVRAETVRIAEQEASLEDGAPLAGFHPLQEIASMRHRSATVRFFAS